MAAGGEDTLELGSVAAGGDGDEVGEGGREEGEVAIGIGNHPGAVGVAAGGKIDGGGGEIDTGGAAAGGGSEGAEVGAFATADVEEGVVGGEGEGLEKSIENGGEEATVVEAAAGGDGGFGIAGLGGAAVLRLEQIPVAGASAVEGMAAGAGGGRSSEGEGLPALADGASEHGSDLVIAWGTGQTIAKKTGSQSDMKNEMSEKPKPRSEKEMQSILEALSASHAVIEFEPDGTILTANRNFLVTMGYELEEIAGRHHRMFVSREYAEGSEYRNFWEVLKRGEYHTGTYPRLAKGGREVWIEGTYNPIGDGTGRIVKVIKFVRDVTAQKKLQQEVQCKLGAIEKTQARIEFEPDGTILDANENFCQAMGYELAEIVGKHHRLFVDAEYRMSDEYARFWQRLGRGESFTGEYRRLAKGEREVWIQASYSPLVDGLGKVVRVVKFASDITPLVQMQRKMKSIAGQNAVGVTRKAVELASDTQRSVAELAGANQEIGAVLRVIASIARQTNLLALNATIEAARAGESGRGFAVVAKEVKDLALKTAEATDNIHARMEAIQTSSAKASGAINEITGVIEQLHGISVSIEEAVCS